MVCVRNRRRIRHGSGFAKPIGYGKNTAAADALCGSQRDCHAGQFTLQHCGPDFYWTGCRGAGERRHQRGVPAGDGVHGHRAAVRHRRGSQLQPVHGRREKGGGGQICRRRSNAADRRRDCALHTDPAVSGTVDVGLRRNGRHHRLCPDLHGDYGLRFPLPYSF